MRKVHRPAPRASDAQLGVQADGLRPPLNYALDKIKNLGVIVLFDLFSKEENEKEVISLMFISMRISLIL